MRTRASRRVLSCLAALTIAVAVCMAGFVAVPSAAEAAASYSSEELAFLGLINQYRQANGLGTLMMSDVISDASDKHNLDMGHYRFFDHTTQGSAYFAVGSSPWDRMAACGYDYNTAMSENIAAGSLVATAEAVFQAWKDSPGHDANMRNSSFKVIGISLEVVQGSPYTYYWTTNFGGFVDPSAHDPGGPPSTTTTTASRDVTQPELSLSAPQAGAQLAGTVTISADASDNVGVVRVEIWVDGLLAAKDTLVPYSFVWDTKLYANGGHSVEGRAFDAARNVATATAAVTLANGQPTTTTTRPPTTTTTAPMTAIRPPTTTTTAVATTTTTVAAPVFTDVQPQDRFYREITMLAAAAVIGGYADNSFRPDNQVTRAQFAKIIMLASSGHTEAVEGTADPTFPDVLYIGDPYPFDFVQEAVALGIIKGNRDGTFSPYSCITRAQLALMLVRAGGDALDTPPVGYRLPFSDVPDYAEEAVALAYYNRLLSGKTDTTFDPYGVATRGQVAKMIYSLLEKLRD